MKNTLSDNRQLFNVKAIASGKTPDELLNGELGVFPAAGGTSLASTTTFAQMPDEVMLISKVGDKFYYSFDTINKNNITSQIAKAYTAETVNKWSTVVEYCDCITSVLLKLNIDEQSLIQRDGLTWTHSDFVVELSTKELECLCDCTGKPVYQNNLMTEILVNKVNSINSPFYEAETLISLTGLTTYANDTARDAAITAPAGGETVINTADAAIQVYNLATTAWLDIATVAGVMTSAQVALFITATTALNSDADTANDGSLLTLSIKGKIQPAKPYADLEVNYIYPRGVKLTPSLIINDSKTTVFTQNQDLVFEIGAGADIRAEEYEVMSLSTNLNFYPRLSDGIQAPGLVYQFENGKNYDTLTLEFASKKSGLEDVFEGGSKMFGIMLASENGLGTVSAKLATMFIPA